MTDIIDPDILKRFYDKDMHEVDDKSDAVFEEIPMHDDNGGIDWVLKEIKKE